MERKVYKHPSFGVLRFSRINGRSGYLFGSEMQCDNYIQLELSEGELNRDMTNDWFHDGNEIIRLKMSPNQFSELITSLNVGVGVPVTIDRINGEGIEQCEGIESKKTYTQNQFKQRMADFIVDINKRYKRANEIINKKTLNKQDQEELKWFYEKMVQEIKSNIPFFAQCFQEVIDKVVLDAKAEIDSEILRRVTSAGLEALKITKNETNEIDK